MSDMTLDQMMEGKTPRTSEPIDLTRGMPAAENNETPVPNVPMQAVPVQTGPVDMSKMSKIDTANLLPKREEAPSQLETDLFGALDKAVEREKESIEERIDAVLEAQDKEREEMAEKAADAAINKELDNNDKDTSQSEDEDDTLGLYDEEETETPTRASSDPKPEFHFTNPLSDDEVEAESDKNDGTEDSESSEEVKQEEQKSEDTTPVIPATKTVNDKIINIHGTIPDDDLFKDESDEPDATDPEEEAKANEMLDSIKKDIKSRVSTITNKLDLSKFTIAKKPISLQKVMKLAVRSHQNVADWMMYSAQRPISMIGLSGPEILKLNPENSNRNRLNTFKDMYRVIYEHVEDANKPEFEAWLKNLRFIDLQHVYFALYMATFGNSNFISYSCPKCNKVFIKDVSFEDMVKYSSDEVKEKVRNIIRGDSTTSTDTYPVDLVQISDEYVFGLRTPSVWNVIIETASLTDRFLENHADLIDLVSYIDSIYVIDMEHTELVPVDTKPDPNDMAKTAARKIKAFYDIISRLNTDEYYSLRAKISEYDKDGEAITYFVPAATCPDCATEIPANEDMNPDTMLFTRHQLAAIANI